VLRLVVDTNVLVSALLSARSPAAQLLDHWEKRHVDLLVCEQQLDELGRVTRYPKIRDRITPSVAGLLVNQLREVAIGVDNVPIAEIPPIRMMTGCWDSQKREMRTTS
jgi:putative PIN family toxin of toxin-antitoxin system